MQGLLKHKLPRLYAHFDALGLHPTMYSAQWFMTIFTYNFPFSVVVRIWDSFLLEGWKVVFRVALGLLKKHEGEWESSSWLHGALPALFPTPHTPHPTTHSTF